MAFYFVDRKSFDTCVPWMWTNVLFINNFVVPDTICAGWAWSIAVEMQFYIISPILVLLMCKHVLVAVGLVVSMVLGSSALVLSVVIPLHIAPENPDGFKYYHEFVYIKTYNRVGPYMFGMLAAYLYHRFKDRQKDEQAKLVIQSGSLIDGETDTGTLTEHDNKDEEQPKVTKMPVQRGLRIGLEVLNHFFVIALLVCMLWIRHSIGSNWYTVMYEGAFERSAVGAITAYIIYMMITKRLVVFNWILSCGIFHFLSQVSYTGYLFSPVAIGWMLMLHVENLGMNVVVLMVDFIISLSFLLIFCVPVYFGIEKPFMNLKY
jgi:peptidoglycan/LPS O-acetylase OafA/YrhL